MIRRTFSPDFLNEVANHPDVHPWLGIKGKADLSGAILNPNNYALVTEGGGFVLMQHEPGIYEVHSQFLPGQRKGTVQAMRDGFEYMFTRTDCERVITQVPDNNPGAVGLAKVARFRLMFRREEAKLGPTAYMGLTVEEWTQDSEYLETHGKWFHAGIEKAKVEQNSNLPDHPHDPAHERAVGASVLMAKAGNIAKSVAFYNRWARLAGYPLTTLVSECPPVFDMGEAVVCLTDGEMEILLCRSE